MAPSSPKRRGSVWGALTSARFSAALVVAFVALAAWLAAACSSDDGGSPLQPGEDGGADVVVPPDAAPGSGVLRVRIHGLPSGQAAGVVVTGPGVERTLFGSADVSLPPGDYEIFAKGVADSTKNDGTGYAPDEASQTVTVPPNAGATADVSYALVTPKIAPETKVATPSAADALATVTRDATNGLSTLTFTQATAETSSWKVGDLVVFGKTDKTPRGFYGRVVKTDGTTVTCSQPALQEMIQGGVIDVTKTFSPQEIAKVTPLDAGIQDLRICNNMSASIGASHSVVGAAITVDGNICFAPTINISGTFYLTHLPDIHFRVGANVTGSVNLTGAATIGIGRTIPIAEIELGTIDIQIGPVPVVILPTLTLYVGAEGTVTAGVTAGVTYGENAYGGFNFDGKKKQFHTFSGHQESFDIIYPQPIATATIRAFGGVSLELLFYDVAGPGISLEPYVQFDVDLLNVPSWVLHGGVSLNAGFETNKLININFDATLFNYDRVILQSTDPPPVSASVGPPVGTQSRPPVDPSAGNLALGPGDVLYVTTGKELRAVKQSGTTVWSYTGDDYMWRVLRAADGTLYAADFSGTVYALTSDGTFKWKKALGFGVDLASPNATTLYAAAGSNLYQLDVANGNILMSPDVGGDTLGIAVAKDGTIYVPTFSSGVVALNPNGTVKWTSAPYSIAAGGAAIAPDGTVYVTIYDGDDKIVALSPTTGATKWSRHALWADQPSAPVVGPDGAIYVCGTNPDPSLAALEPVHGDTSWKTRLNENCKGPPAVSAAGDLYVMTDANMRAVHGSNGAIAWTRAWPSLGGSPIGSPVFLSNGFVASVSEGGLGVFAASASLPTSGWPRAGGNASSSGVAQ